MATTIVFDVETTGTDRRRDQVIEICIQFGLEAEAESRTWRIKPRVPISPGAQAVHGIAMEDLADCPSFGVLAEELRGIFAKAEVVIGYNIAFDIDMLLAEYERLRLPPVDFGDKQVVDAFRLWQQCEPRSLQHAHRRFVGDSFAEAHSATADVAATGRVLRGMIEHFGLDGSDWGVIAKVCEPERARWVGPSRHIQWSESGVAVLGFGKHSGKALHELAIVEGGGYLRWMLSKDFPAHVHEICRRALDLPNHDLCRWLQEAFGAALASTSGRARHASQASAPVAASAAGGARA